MKKSYLFIYLVFLSFNLFSQAITPPFVEDFESGQNGWTSGGSNSTWEFGTPNKLGLTSAPSGDNAWVLGGLSDSYLSNETSWVRSPEYDLTSVNNPIINFNISYRLALGRGDGVDSVTMHYSLDQGSSWVNITNPVGSSSWYKGGWFGSISGIEEASAYLPELSGESSVIFRVSFGNGNWSVLVGGGFVFDDFQISEYTDDDLKPYALQKRSSRYFSDSEAISVIVYNNGSNPISSFDLSYSMNDGPTHTETFAVDIPVFSYDTLNFSGVEDMSQIGSYDFKIWSDLTGDDNTANDTIYSNLTKLDSFEPTLPYEIGFESNFKESGTVSVPEISNYPEFELILGEEGLYQSFRSRNGNELKGNKFLSMDSYNTTQNTVAHYNLSALDANVDNLILSYIANASGTVTVEVRADNTSNWIAVDQITSSTVLNYSYDISEILVNNGDNFSESTQIRFVNPRNSRFNLDAFRLETVKDNELSILSQSLKSDRFLSNSEPLSVELINIGTATLQNFDITYQIDENAPVVETVTSAVERFDTLTYDFVTPLDLSEFGNHSISVWTSLPDDEMTANDTLTVTIENLNNPLVDLPILFDFEEAENVNVRNFGDQFAFGSERRFDLKTTAPDGYYQITENRYFIEGKSIGLAENGSDNFNELTLNLNLSNYTVASDQIGLRFSFIDLGSFQYETDRIYIRGSRDDSWLLLYDWYNSPEDVIIDVAKNVSEILAANGQDFSNLTQLRFDQGGRFLLGSEGLVIDNIGFSQLKDNDLGIEDQSLKSSRFLSNSEELSVEVFNFGSQGQTTYDVYYQVNNEAVVKESINSLINPLTNYNYTFTNKLDLSANGTYEIKIWTDLATEEGRANDTLTTTIKKHPNPVVSLPFLIDFEQGSSFAETGDTLVFGNEGRFDFLTSYEAGKIRVFNESGAIDNKSLEIATSTQDNNALIQSLNLSNFNANIDKLLLEFDHKNNTGFSNSQDRVFIRGSVNDPWITLYDWSSNSRSTISRPYLNISDTLQLNGQDFSASTQLKFGQSDYRSESLVIDNISISKLSANDLAIKELSANLESSRTLSNNEFLSVEVYNNGINMQQNFPIYYQVNNGPVVQETVLNAIASLDTMSYTFGTPLDLSTDGTYTINIWTALTGDLEQTNDTISIAIEKYPNPEVALPLKIDFESDSPFSFQGDTTYFGDAGRFDFFSPNGEGKVHIFDSFNLIENNTLGMGFSGWDASALILNLNLSSFTVDANKLLFNFDYIDYETGNRAGDQVFIRGNENDPWITLYDWNGNKDDVILNVSLNISDTLMAYGQVFSPSTQIKFGQAKFSSLSIDNLHLTELFSEDLSISSINTELQPARLFKGDETLSIDIYNIGFSPQQNFEVYYKINDQTAVQETVSNTIASLETLEYTFTTPLDLSTDGIKDIKIWTALSGEMNQSNDTVSLSVVKYPNPLVELPLSLDFENDSNFYMRGDTTLFGSARRFDFLTANGRGSASIFTSSDAIDNKSLKIESILSDTSQLVLNLNLSAYNVSDNKLFFAFDFKNLEAEDEEMEKVFVRGNRNDPWITLYNWNTSTRDIVNSVSLSISDRLQSNGQEFSNTTQIKFTQLNDAYHFDESMVIDNLKLEEISKHDLGVVSTVMEETDVFSAEETLQISLYNFGAEAKQGFDIFYQIDNGAVVQETVSEIIAPFDTLDYSFSTSADLSEAKQFQIKAWTGLAYDTDFSNDTLEFQLENLPTVSLPYAEDFESGNGDWTSGGVNNSWFYGRPNKLGYDAAQNNYAWILGDSDGDYQNNENSFIESPLFNFSSIDSGYFSVDIIYNLESGPDDLKVQYSTDLGTTWEDLNQGVSNWFSGNGWTGSSFGTINAKADISSLISSEAVKFRFYFESDGTVSAKGAIIDNIVLKSYSTEDLGILAIGSNLQSSRSLTDSEILGIDIVNKGITTQQNFEVFYQVNEDEIIQEMVSTAIANLDTLTFNFSTPLNLSNAGTYDLKVWTALSGDLDQSNDTINISIEKYPNPLVELPLVLNFEEDPLYLQQGDSALFGESRRFDFRSYLDRGQVQIIEGNYAIAGRSLGLSSVASSQQILTVNLNMDSYQVASDKVGFEFDYINLDDEVHPADIVRIRGNSSEPWITVYNWNTGIAFSTLHVSLNLSDLLMSNGQEYSASTQIEFVQDDNSTLGSDGLLIDNMEFIQIDSDDIGVLGANLPTSSADFTSTESLTIDIYNYGIEAKQNFDVFYQLDSETVVQETVTATVDPEDTFSYTFNTPLDLSVEKLYQLKSWTELVGDTIASNDTLQMTVNHFPIFTVPYQQDFENGSANWTAGGTNSSWEYGVPVKFGYDSLQNASAWALGGLDSTYFDAEQSYLESPSFNFSGYDSVYFSANISYELESNFDYLKLQYSTDLGMTWITLTTGLSNWYSGEGWSGSGEIRAIADVSELSAFQNVKFRFFFNSDNSVKNSGAIIDNVELKAYPSVDLMISDYSIPSLADSPGSSETIEVRVLNLGRAFDNAVIEYSLNENQVYQDTLSALGAFEEQTIVLSNTLDFTMQCINQLRISLIAENDSDQSNNIIESVVYTNSDPIGNLITADSLTICINDDPIQLESEINDGTWTGTGVTESGEFDPEIAGAGIHEILFETYAEGCRNYDSLTVKVEAIISGTIDESVEGKLTAPDATSYRWFIDDLLLSETSQTIDTETSGFYKVEVTNEAGCVSIIEVGQVLNTNTELAKDHYRIYPNPAKDYLMIQVSPELSDVKAQLYSFEGKLLMEIPLFERNSILDLTNQVSGTYILKLLSKEGIATKKVFIH